MSTDHNVWRERRAEAESNRSFRLPSQRLTAEPSRLTRLATVKRCIVIAVLQFWVLAVGSTHVLSELVTSKTVHTKRARFCLCGLLKKSGDRFPWIELPPLSISSSPIDKQEELVGSCTSESQTHNIFKRTLFIRTKHNIRIFRVIPLIKLENKTKMRWRAN